MKQFEREANQIASTDQIALLKQIYAALHRSMSQLCLCLAQSSLIYFSMIYWTLVHLIHFHLALHAETGGKACPMPLNSTNYVF